MEELLTFFERTKKEFCSLFKYKIHGATIELITPFATLSDKFISVFVTQRGSKMIASDGGFIAKNIYEYPIGNEAIEIIQRVTNQFIDTHNIKYKEANGTLYYYKDTNKIEMLSAIVFDIINFITGVVNANCLEYKDKKEKEERDRFKTETNEFLKDIYKDAFTANKQIVVGLTINGVIQTNNEIHLLEYITGHNQRYFAQDMKNAIVNFELAGKSDILNIKNRIAVINDLSNGYQVGLPPLLSNYLGECTTKENVLRSNIKGITSIISMN